MTEQLTAQTRTPHDHHKPSPWGRLGAAIAVMLALAAGVLLMGRIAPTEQIAVVLTGVWFAVVLVAAVLVARRRRHLATPMGAGYALAAAAALVLLGLPQLQDREVAEQVVTGAPDQRQADTGDDAADTGDTGDDAADSGDTGEAQDDAAEAGDAAGAPDDAAAGAGDEAADDSDGAGGGNLQLATGEFSDLEHPGSGTASVVEVAGTDRVLTFTDFSTDSGPDLRVYLTTDDPREGDIGQFVDLGALKGNRGDQQYEIDADVDHEEYRYAVVWCRAFAVGFTSAELAPEGV